MINSFSRIDLLLSEQMNKKRVIIFAVRKIINRQLKYDRSN